MFILISVLKIYPSCYMDDNRLKAGNNLIIADKRVAEHFKADYLGIKWSVCGVQLLIQECFKNIQSSLVKIGVFLKNRYNIK